MTISFEPAHGQFALALRRRDLEVRFFLWRWQNHFHVAPFLLIIGADVILNLLLEIVQFLDDLRPAQASIANPHHEKALATLHQVLNKTSLRSSKSSPNSVSTTITHG